MTIVRDEVTTRMDGTTSVTEERSLLLRVGDPHPGVCLVQVAGELDLLTAPRLVSCVRSVLYSRPRHLVMDLSRIDFLGASGLHALVFTKDACAHCGTELHVTGARQVVVAGPLRLYGLDRVLTVHWSWAAALDAIEAAAPDRHPTPRPRQGAAAPRKRAGG